MKITFSQARKRRQEHIERMKEFAIIAAFIGLGIYTFILNERIYAENTDYLTQLVDAGR